MSTLGTPSPKRLKSNRAGTPPPSRRVQPHSKRKSGKQAQVEEIKDSLGIVKYVVKTYTRARLKTKTPPWVSALREHAALERVRGDARFVQLKCGERPNNMFTGEKLPCPARGKEVETVYLEPLVEAPKEEGWWESHRERLKEAIESLHRRGVVHNDLRRDNIMCRIPRGDPVLIDFGLAATVDVITDDFLKVASKTDTLEYIFDEPPQLGPLPSIGTYRR